MYPIHIHEKVGVGVLVLVLVPSTHGLLVLQAAYQGRTRHRPALTGLLLKGMGDFRENPLVI